MELKRLGTAVACVVLLATPTGGRAEPSGPTEAMIARIAPPLPPRRPPPAVVGEPSTGEAPAQPPGNTADGTSPERAAQGSACREELARLGVRFEVRPSLKNGMCGAPEPLLVSGLADGVAVDPPATMTCPVAEALARWSREVLKVEAERHLQSAPTKILIGTSYECRNQRSGGKMSEHAFANGLDLMGFAFAGRPNLLVGSPAAASPEAVFEGEIRKRACSYFTTVLGPGSDAAHGDHLHVDMRARKAGYRICQ